MQSDKNDLYQSTLLSGISGLVHGYSTRTYGDARIEQNTHAIASALAYGDGPIVRGQQVHGNDIAEVNSAVTAVISGVDGLVSRRAGLLLEVHVADCVPVLLVDPNARVIAAVHAGWKGTLSHIVANAVKKMTDMGATRSDIYASIGPHIGGCCYTVQDDRAVKFLSVFGDTPSVAAKKSDGWHLDIGYANRCELLNSGIAPDHIDAPILCTSCQIDTFYSYRKDSKDTFGELIGVIGYTA